MRKAAFPTTTGRGGAIKDQIKIKKGYREEDKRRTGPEQQGNQSHNLTTKHRTKQNTKQAAKAKETSTTEPTNATQGRGEGTLPTATGRGRVDTGQA